MTKGRLQLIRVIALLFTTTILATAEHANDDPVDTAVAHMGVGAGLTFIEPSSRDGQSSRGVTFVYRWHSFHSSWGPTFGFDWRSTDFNRALGSADAPFGTLRTRALLAGFGHTQHAGRFSTSVTVSGGYSFNHLSVGAAAAPAFATAGITLLGASVDNSAVVKPEVSAWYDIAKHVGIGISAAYLVTRPHETLTTATGAEVQHLRADAVELTAGLTFGVWRKH